MERPDAAGHHVIDIPGGSEPSTSTSLHHDDAHSSGADIGAARYEDAPSAATAAAATRLSVSWPSGFPNGSNSRNSSFVRRGDARRQRSPLDSGVWICIELVLTIGQIVGSVIVLCLSRDEHPHTPLPAWIVGYASGCVATLPLLYWRYYHNCIVRQQDSSRSRQNSPRVNDPPETFLSASGTNRGEEAQSAAGSSRSNLASWMMNARLKVLVEYLKIAIDCFFAVWFVVGNVWIFGGHSSANDAPNLYRLCVVFLTFSCIGYAMPFILCATICCCLPCIISILGVREDLTQTQGASSESINALPTYKFKMKKRSRGESNSAVGEGGIVAAGTEKERMISGEDAVCCICLAKYENNDELRELRCSHLFHKECVDKWLKMNAICPLCKSEVGENFTGSVSGGEDATQQRVENGLSNTST